jgi:hypothetical protein
MWTCQIRRPSEIFWSLPEPPTASWRRHLKETTLAEGKLGILRRILFILTCIQAHVCAAVDAVENSIFSMLGALNPSSHRPILSQDL